MRHILAGLLMILGFGGFMAARSLEAADPGPHAALITIDGAIDPISARFLSRGIDAATKDGAQSVIVRLDTPGGLLDSTRDMVEDILASDIPVIVYVAPSGARAASAGTFIAAAAHVAAMAPATNIGAAAPVGPAGEDLPETLKSKATQDAAAFIRGIAEERGRNADALEDTVLNAASYPASEALAKNIIDLIAKDIDDLLAQLDGRSVMLADREVVLETEGLAVREIKRNPVERFLGVLADPNIAFLLMSLGGLGIIVELWNPGLFVPGIFGVIALALAFVALGNLPVNWVGVALISLGIVLFVVELQAPGTGVFGIGGGVSFVLGAFLLFGSVNPPGVPAPGFKVSIWVIASVSVILFAFLILLFGAALKAKRFKHPTQAQSLVGRTGRATTPLDPNGTVQVASELWSALSDSGESIAEGEEVMVLEVEGVTLKVFRASEASE